MEMQTIRSTKNLLLSVSLITIIFILRTTCINSTDDHLITNSPLKQSQFTSIKSCSKWNPVGETIVGEEYNTQLNDLESITIIRTDMLYVVDRYHGKTRLQVFSSGSSVGRTLWNGLDSIVLIDENGTVYTASYEGYIERWLENAKEGEKINCRCSQCSRIWFDSEQQDFYMVERFRSRILKCNINTNTTVTIAGITDLDGSSNETFSYPYTLYVNDVKDIYITDVNNQRIQKWTQNATAGITVAGQTRKTDHSNASLHRPYDVIVDNNGFLYIADMINHRILRWKEGAMQGEILCGVSGESSNSTLHLNRPKSLAFDSEGNLYVADVGNKRVQKFTIDNSACLLQKQSDYIDTKNNDVIAIWNTQAGKKSYSTSIGDGKGQMAPYETVSNIFDYDINTKYMSFGSSSADIMSRKSGLNTGFYVTLDAGVCIVTGFQFTTAMSHPKRDPMIITLEGSNADNSSLTFGSSWTLMYNGSAGLDINPGRGKTGSVQMLNNSRSYRSYRILVVSKRGIESGVHYSEFAFYGHSCSPGDHTRARDTMVRTRTTSAYMTVTNDYPQPMILTTSTNINMKETFPSQTIGAGRTSFSSVISTGNGMAQSYFDIAHGSNTIKIDIGQEDYVTDANFFGPKGQTGAVLAPTKPFSKDTDFSFYVFGGPGILPPLINSFVAANLPAIVAYVSVNPVSFNLSADMKLTIKQLNLTPQSIHCSYAALSPAHYQENNQEWYLNMILNLNGKIFGSITYHSMSMDFNVTLGGVSMLTQTTINISNPQTIFCTITHLAFSIQSFGINNDLLMLIKTFFVSWYKLIDTPYHLASTLNTKYNSIIIDKLNIAINKFINTTLIKDAFTKKSNSDRRFFSDIHQTEQTETNYSRWMSSPKIQAKILSQLKIPGTHNSGSYSLTRKLSQIIYANIKFLWNLNPDAAPANGQLPFGKDKIYVGRILLDYVIDSVLRISISQNRTIRQQLDDGIRFFDLRVYYDTDGSFYIQHGLRGPELNDILAQIRNFLDDHSTSGELIFLSISHTNFSTDSETLPTKVTTIIQNNLKPYLYMPANSVGIKNFDFQSLKNTTLSSITTTNSHSMSPKVIVLNTGDSYYKDTVVNTRGFADSGRWEINSDGVNSVAELIKLEGEQLKKNIQPMYHISWIQTPQIMDIIQSIASHLGGSTSTILPKQLALETNSALQSFLTNHTTSAFNLITMDWYDISSTVNPVKFIIGLN